MTPLNLIGTTSRLVPGKSRKERYLKKLIHLPVRSEFFPDLKSEIPCSVE